MKPLFTFLMALLLVVSCKNDAVKDPSSAQSRKAMNYNFVNKGNLMLIGTEPFWNVTFDTDGILKYQSIDSTQNLAFTIVEEHLIDSLTYQYNGKNNAGDFMEITLHKAVCSDGMSDVVYPYCADVKLTRRDVDSAEVLQGCGDYK